MQLNQYTLDFVADPNSGKRLESWVLGVETGPVLEYMGRRIDLNEEFLKKIARNTRRAYLHFDQMASGEPYRFPIKREHRSNGEREGDILEVKYANKEVKGRDYEGLWFKVRWTEEMSEAIRTNRVKNTSPGLRKYKAQDGTEFGVLAAELSLTVDPFQKNTPTIQDTLGVELNQAAIAELNALEEEDMEKLLEAIEALTQKVEEQGEAIRALNDQMKDRSDEEPTDDRTEPEDDTTTSDEPEGNEPPEVDASEDDDETTEPDVPKTREVDDASTGEEAPVTMSQLKSFFNEKFGKSNLNLSEQGHQGSPEVPAADRDSRYQELRKQGYSPTEAAKRANQ